MEVKEPAWLSTDHPNYTRWHRARELSVERGKFVVSIIEQYKKCEGLTILDLGSGEGGTAGVLSFKNKVISADLSFIRLERQSKYRHNHKINCDAKMLPFKEKSFDIIILQDVIEHIPYNKELVNSLKPYLKWDGIIYLSTPNKNSIFNIISDPHWGLPLLALYKRYTIRTSFLSRFREKDKDRDDIAELLSLTELVSMTSEYNFNLNTNFAVQELFAGNNGIVWSSFHLKIISLLKIFRLQKFILKGANDHLGIINNHFTPTFYIVLTKK